MAATVITIIQRQAMWTNLAAEAAGLAFTVLVVDVIRAKQNEEREKRDLILQMGSPDNAFAREAVRRLRMRGWLYDGSVRGANLFGADLHRADLVGADLRGARLCGADLRRADLRLADLQMAALMSTKLQKACLIGAKLSGAGLSEADLSGARVTDEQLAQAASLKSAALPDGTVHE